MKVLIYSVLVMMGAPLFAEERVDVREENQEQRIEQGQQSGALTDKEAQNLQKQQDRIEKREEKMRADGKLTPREKRRLERAQDRASRHIYRAKHNRRVK